MENFLATDRLYTLFVLVLNIMEFSDVLSRLCGKEREAMTTITINDDELTRLTVFDNLENVSHEGCF